MYSLHTDASVTQANDGNKVHVATIRNQLALFYTFQATFLVQQSFTYIGFPSNCFSLTFHLFKTTNIFWSQYFAWFSYSTALQQRISYPLPYDILLRCRKGFPSSFILFLLLIFETIFFIPTLL
uniref:Uncharacterized protein n=1 Tax=Octopus bimaculoides TaxID=37653 RepID=A0A0L8GDK9_OCTBM